MKDKQIFLFASFGNLDEVPAGGGQTSARRLLNTLVRIGYRVKPTNRHRPISNNRFLFRFEVLFWAFVDPILFALRLLFMSRKKSLVLFIGYSGAMLPMETVIGLLVRLLGYKVIFFLKGGGAKSLYENGSFIYRLLFKYSIRLYNEVFVEGEENAGLIHEISNTSVFYLPNFTEDGFAPEKLSKKPESPINIIYFGRICNDKNVLLILDIYDKICDLLQNTNLTVIGDGDKGYLNKVKKRIEISHNKKTISLMSKQNHDYLKSILEKQHFFLFPSSEKREGHSNALNEAMAWGVVPIVSDNNFLPSIVGDDSLVVHDMDISSYVGIIQDLIQNKGLYDIKSQQVYDRVRCNFTQTIVENKLNEEIKKIYNF